MINIIVSTLIASLLSGILYHLGGQGGAWYKKSKVRDVGCSIVLLALWIYLKGLVFNAWWVYIATFALSWVFLSMYWKIGTDSKWYNWFLHGFFAGLATLPFIWTGVAWWLILLRAVVCGLLMMAWSEKIDDDFWEESGRGFIYLVTLPILLI